MDHINVDISNFKKKRKKNRDLNSAKNIKFLGKEFATVKNMSDFSKEKLCSMNQEAIFGR